jgi:hypothetical protein
MASLVQRSTETIKKMMMGKRFRLFEDGVEQLGC